ncbi:MAG: gluconate 5-dehydrogenase [Anaerolineaceae bacterium]|nr:gluconate 5-dehydrogenase [Anaerolineaceae bacterium]
MTVWRRFSRRYDLGPTITILPIINTAGEIHVSLDLFDLTGKVALVTGSSRGLGNVIAQGLGRAGATVVLNGNHPERLDNAVQALNDAGIRTYGANFDVTDANQVNAQIARIEAEVGPVDVLFNNAGIQIRKSLENYDDADWQRLLNVNLTGAYLVSKAVVQRMIERRAGKIVNICSIQSELGRPSIAPYAATKGGLKMLTKGMATEWGKYNIQVNGLGPGYFVTEMTQPLVDDEQFDSWLRSRTPANRWGDPEELIGAAVFLASRASSYVNGHILYVDGGMLACV